MAKVTITFEDTVGGPMDGSVHMRFVSNPPFPSRDGKPIFDLCSQAQRQGLRALVGAEAGAETISSAVTAIPMDPDQEPDPADPRDEGRP